MNEAGIYTVHIYCYVCAHEREKEYLHKVSVEKQLCDYGKEDSTIMHVHKEAELQVAWASMFLALLNC